MARDPAAIGANVKEFVAAFNSMSGKLAALRSGDAASDSALNQVTAQMGQVLDGADRKPWPRWASRARTAAWCSTKRS